MKEHWLIMKLYPWDALKVGPAQVDAHLKEPLGCSGYLVAFDNEAAARDFAPDAPLLRIETPERDNAQAETAP